MERGRLRFLDSLRGVAALAVFFEHAGGLLWPGFRDFRATRLQLGQFGVSLFFLCSGFVIPYTLERHDSLRRFWINRFFRLYPLYWVSLGLALLLWMAGVFALPQAFTARLAASIAANLTMLQGWMGFEHAIGPYWSLGYEMVFYAGASVLLALGLSRRTFTWLALLLALAVLNPLVARFVLHRTPHPGVVFHFVTMFLGTLVYRAYSRELPRARFFQGTALALAGAAAVAALSFLGNDNPAYFGTRSFAPMLSAWLCADLVFLAAFALRKRGLAGGMSHFGRISYSLYLLHPLVIACVPAVAGPRATFALWFAVTWALAALSYRLIEQPAIALGKRFLARTEAPAYLSSTPNPIEGMSHWF